MALVLAVALSNATQIFLAGDPSSEGGVSQPGGQGSKIYVYPRSPRNIDLLPGYPIGKTGDQGPDRI